MFDLAALAKTGTVGNKGDQTVGQMVDNSILLNKMAAQLKSIEDRLSGKEKNVDIKKTDEYKAIKKFLDSPEFLKTNLGKNVKKSVDEIETLPIEEQQEKIKEIIDLIEKEKEQFLDKLNKISKITGQNNQEIIKTQNQVTSTAKAFAATASAFFKPIMSAIGGITDELKSLVSTVLAPFAPFIEASKAAFNILNKNSPEEKLKKQVESSFLKIKDFFKSNFDKTNESQKILEKGQDNLLKQIFGVKEKQDDIKKENKKIKAATEQNWLMAVWNKAFMIAQFLAILPMIAFMFVAVGFIFLFVLSCVKCSAGFKEDLLLVCKLLKTLLTISKVDLGISVLFVSTFNVLRALPKD
jgi:hypothetical protein